MYFTYYEPVFSKKVHIFFCIVEWLQKYKKLKMEMLENKGEKWYNGKEFFAVYRQSLSQNIYVYILIYVFVYTKNDMNKIVLVLKNK